MKIFISYLLFWGCLILKSQTGIPAAENNEQGSDISLSEERILFFSADITVQPNTRMRVKETIKVIGNGNTIKRGIYRSLPTKRELNNVNHHVKYEVISIKKDGLNEDYHVTSGRDFVIYIGNEDIFLNRGIYTYEIVYESDNHIGFFKDHDELYWNVNGNDWSIPVDSVHATITLPQKAEITQNACYTGYYGSTQKNCQSLQTSDNTISWSASNLNTSEGLTVAVGFKKGVIDYANIPASKLKKYNKKILIAFISFLLLLIVYMYYNWSKYGRDPQKPIPYPQFEVPHNLSPASLGYLENEQFQNRYLTADIVDLAIKGYIEINEKSKSLTNTGVGFINNLLTSRKFTLQKLKNPDENLNEEETFLMNKMFPDSEEIFSLDIHSYKDIEELTRNFKNYLLKEYNSFLNEETKYSETFGIFIIITLIYFGSMIFAYNLGMPKELLKDAGIIYLVTLFFYGMFSVYSKFFIFFIIFFTTLSMVILYILSRYISSNDIPEIFIINIGFLWIGFIITMIYKRLILRPTVQKLQVQSDIEGFEMYLKTAESNRLKMLNPPEFTPEHFEKLLPYAIALGVDNIWGERLNKMLDVNDQDYEPSWYHGNYSDFSSIAIGSALSSTINSANSNSSGGGGGSGGGGSSGGGGGGGGGGGW